MAGPSRQRAGPPGAGRAPANDPAGVLAAAARFMEARPRSVEEIRRRLGAAGFQSDLVEAAIARLGELGMLDDAAFARAWTEARDRTRPRSARALRQELRRKGVADEVIEQALAAREASAAGEGEDEDEATAALEAGERASSEASDRAAAERLLERRGGTLLREPDPRRRRSRAFGLLVRGGFDPEVSREVVAGWLARTGLTGEA
jgi:regulatory protein